MQTFAAIFITAASQIDELVEVITPLPVHDVIIDCSILFNQRGSNSGDMLGKHSLYSNASYYGGLAASNIIVWETHY